MNTFRLIPCAALWCILPLSACTGGNYSFIRNYFRNTHNGYSLFVEERDGSFYFHREEGPYKIVMQEGIECTYIRSC
ncbi:MAG: hypothetical protein IBJ09_05795 [Bacteroidia bacterium]|nr:hypothetical protein [Bacteroidia bacterium]